MASFNPDHAATPPMPPPKSGSHETSRIATPTSSSVPPAPPPPPPQQQSQNNYAEQQSQSQYQQQQPSQAQQPQQYLEMPPQIPDPGDGWLPQSLQDKSIQDLAAILANPQLLQALTHAPDTIHPSLKASHDALTAALQSNMDVGAQLADLEARLAHARSATQAQLLSTHGLERQWRQRQSDVDHALAPFSPAALYQQLGQGVQEQAQVCQAVEESFLESGGGDGGPLSERDVAEWVRRYREARVLFYLRQERKERWDEGRVGGWR